MTLEHLLEAGTWTTPPVDAQLADGRLLVTAQEGSDAWRRTSYGFVHDTEHALLEPFGAEDAVEVGFVLDFGRQFDQAGVFLRVDEAEWIKAGVEVSDGVAQVGAVVTHGASDWSVAPVPEWVGREVTVRLSRSGDAVTVRARADDGPWQLVRVAYLEPGSAADVGLFCCSPTRAGLRVAFTRYGRGERDESLHP